MYVSYKMLHMKHKKIVPERQCYIFKGLTTEKTALINVKKWKLRKTKYYDFIKNPNWLFNVLLIGQQKQVRKRKQY